MLNVMRLEILFRRLQEVKCFPIRKIRIYKTAKAIQREGGGVEVRDVIAIILLLVVILSAISSFISIIFYCGIGILEKLSGPKYAQATCPRCSTAVIEEYSFIKPRMWTCPYCGIKIKYEKAD